MLRLLWYVLRRKVAKFTNPNYKPENWPVEDEN